MGKNNEFDNQMEGQMTIEDLYAPPERMVAVSNIFAHARKEMSLAEQKTFVYALSQMNWTKSTESHDTYVRLDKKVLANILGIHSDIDHLSWNMFNEIKDLPKHSYITIIDKDQNFFSSGFIITNITSFKNMVRIKFEEDYLPLFTGLTNNYITMWSSDIFKMTNKRSVQFYELLRQMSYGKYEIEPNVYSYGWGIKAFKDMFGIPKDGKGSYMTKDGHFARTHFEKYVIDPICEDLAKCKLIQLIILPDGKPYEKVKRGNRVDGYQFYWTFTKYPAVAEAHEVKEIQDRVDKNPQVLKVAKDIVNGEKKTKKQDKNSFKNFNQREYSDDFFENLEKANLNRMKGDKENGNA